MGLFKRLFAAELPLPKFSEIIRTQWKNRNSINMNDVVGNCDILFICLDSLRYDIAYKEQENGGTPHLNQCGNWEKRGAAGNFTYPSHHAMFAGFLPMETESTTLLKKDRLFFPKNIGLGRISPPRAFSYETPTFIEGLAKVGYETICIGGVAFFNKRTALGCVFPDMFNQSYWQPNFGCSVKESPDNQIKKAKLVLEQMPSNKRVMMYVNICAIHYPNYFYLEKCKEDNLESHAAALRYVDERLPHLFEAFSKRGKTFVIICSDHGSCYPEADGGYLFHGFNHEAVNIIPYKHFFLE